MASSTLKLIVLAVCLNTFMYLGVNYAIQTNTNTPLEQKPFYKTNLFDLLMDNPDNVKQGIDMYARNVTTGQYSTIDYSQELSGNLTSSPNVRADFDISGESGNISFLDPVIMTIAFIRTLWEIVIVGFLIIFSYNVFPPVVGLIIGVPLVVLTISALVVLIRGGGAT